MSGGTHEPELRSRWLGVPSPDQAGRSVELPMARGLAHVFCTFCIAWHEFTEVCVAYSTDVACARAAACDDDSALRMYDQALPER